MQTVVAARDACGADDAVTIAISPRDSRTAAIEAHRAAFSYEARFASCRARFVTIEHAEHARARDAIDVSDDMLSPPAGRCHAGIRTEIVQSARRDGWTEISRNAAQPTRHRDVDERP